jgi:hypothetical protein
MNNLSVVYSVIFIKSIQFYRKAFKETTVFCSYEEKFPSVEETETNALEVAA